MLRPPFGSSPAFRGPLIAAVALFYCAVSYNAGPSSAQSSLTFTSSSAFQASVNVLDVLTFDGIPNGVVSSIEGGFPGVTYYSSGSSGPVMLVAPNGNSNAPGFTTVSQWIVHDPTYQFYLAGAHSGDALIPSLGSAGGDGIRFEFDEAAAITAAGANFGSVQEPTPCCVSQWVDVVFWDGGVETIDLNAVRGGEQNTDSFFGYAAPGRPIRSIEFNQLGHNALLDNFMYGRLVGEPAPFDAVGSIIGVTGNAVVTRPNGDQEPIGPGTQIGFGDVIETGEGASLTIKFNDNSEFGVGENARLTVDEYVYDPDAGPVPPTNMTVLRSIFTYLGDRIGSDLDDSPQCPPSCGSLGHRGDATPYLNKDTLDVAVTMNVGSPVSLAAPVPAVHDATQLSFDFAFLTPTGELEVRLGDTLIYSTSAVENPVLKFQHATIDVPATLPPSPGVRPVEIFPAPPPLFSKSLILVPADGGVGLTTLSFRFDGPTGSKLLLDAVTFPGLQNGEFSQFDEGWFWTGPGHIDLVATIPEDKFAALQKELDPNPPSTSALVSPAPNAEGWHKSDVTVTLSAIDDADGLGVQSITTALTGAQTGGGVTAGAGAVVPVSTEGITTITYFARDVAGNEESQKTLEVKLDKTAPIITPPPNQTAAQTGPAGAAVTYPDAAISDTTSGVASSGCLPASGTVFPIGVTTVTCTATDRAGNTGTKTFTVTVTPAPPSEVLDGLMFGRGRIDIGKSHHHFVFRVAQHGDREYGRLEYWAIDPRFCRTSG